MTALAVLYLAGAALALLGWWLVTALEVRRYPAVLSHRDLLAEALVAFAAAGFWPLVAVLAALVGALVLLRDRRGAP